MSVPKKRPTGITITAWVWIVTGGLMILSAVMSGFAYIVIDQMGAPLPPPHGMPSGAVAISSLFRYFGFLLVAQGLIALTAMSAGIAFLRLRKWARATIEMLCWLALLYTVGFGIFWIYTWISITGQMAPGAPVNNAPFQWMGVIMTVVFIALFAVPLGIMIRYLRGAEVKAAIANAIR